MRADSLNRNNETRPTLHPLPKYIFGVLPRFWEARDQPEPGTFSSNDMGGRERDPGNEVGRILLVLTEGETFV